MPVYIYQGRDASGALLTDKRYAQSMESLGTQLMNEGILPVKILLESSTESIWSKVKKISLEKKLSLDDIGFFSRQMYTLCKTGVPLAGALRQLAAHTRVKLMSDALYGMVSYLEAGQDLAASMSYYPKVFSPIMISMVRVGQNSGNLAEAFLQINRYIELESIAVKNVKTAMRYPIFVLISLFIAIIVINMFVIPSFASVFLQAKVELPWATRFLMGASSFMRHNWLLLSVFIFFSACGFIYYIQTDKGKYQWHKFLLKIPIVGSLLKQIVVLRFAQTFAIVIKAGIPLITGLDLIAGAVNNVFARSKILAMREAIAHGNSLTQAVSVTGLFSPLELQMFRVSEETGDLSDMLLQMVTYYQREIDYNLKRLTDVIEPLLILMLSVVILILAFAVYLPIWNMVKLAKIG